MPDRQTLENIQILAQRLQHRHTPPPDKPAEAVPTIEMKSVSVEWKIPNLIHFVWIGPEPLPWWARYNIDRFRALNPLHRILLHDESILADAFRPGYEAITGQHEWARKSDLIRMSAFMVHNGGWYFDTDFLPLKPLSEIIKAHPVPAGFFLTELAPKIANGVIGLAPGAPLFSILLGELHRMAGHPKEYYWGAYGPGLFTTTYLKHKDLAVVAPQSEFYPRVRIEESQALWVKVVESDCNPDIIADAVGLGAFTLHMGMRSKTKMEHERAPVFIKWASSKADTAVREAKQAEALAARGDVTVPATLSKRPIPKLVHFVWIGPPMPDYAKSVMAQWKKLNPKYTFLVHGEEILLPRFKQGYDAIADREAKVEHGKHELATKSDLLRICALVKFGGFYFDLDCWPLRPLDELYSDFDNFPRGFWGVDGDNVIMPNGFLGASINSPFLKLFAEELERRCTQKPKEWWSYYGCVPLRRLSWQYPDLLHLSPLHQFMSIDDKDSAIKAYRQVMAGEKVQLPEGREDAYVFHMHMAGDLIPQLSTEKTEVSEPAE